MGKYKPTGQPTGRPSKKMDVKTWMQTAVVTGKPQQAMILIGNASERGFSERTVNAVKKELGLHSIRKNRVWYWSVEATPILQDVVEDPEGPHDSKAITDENIVTSAAIFFEGRARSCGFGDFTEAMLYGAKATRTDDAVIGILSELLQDVRESPNSSAYSKERVTELMFQGLDAVLADNTLEPQYRTRLSKLTAYKPAPQLTFAERVSKMPLQEVSDLLRSFDDMEAKGVTITEEMSKNKEIVCARLKELEPQPQNTSVF